MDILTPYMGKVFISLFFIISILLGLGAFMKRTSQRRRGTLVSCEEGINLDAKRRLVVITWQHTEYLVLLSSTHETIIDKRSCEKTSPEQHHDKERMAPTFSKPYELAEYHAVR